MDMTTKLHGEISNRINGLSKLNPSSEEYSDTVNNVTKLMDRAIEIEKLEMTETQNMRQLKEDRRSRIVKNVIDAGSIVLPLTVTVWGALVSLKFEEEGSITTTIGRKTLDKLFKR